MVKDVDSTIKIISKTSLFGIYLATWKIKMDINVWLDPLIFMLRMQNIFVGFVI